MHLVGILFPHINDDARSKSHQIRTFEFKTGLKQGDGLSTTLFIIVLHKVMREIDRRGTVFNKLSQICTYANDVVLITKTKRKLTQISKEDVPT